MNEIIEQETGALNALAGSELLARYNHSLLGVFGTPQRVLVRGAGCHVCCFL